MACFIVPAAVGIITTACRKKIPEAIHLNWLNIMLWGGVIMLLVDHIANNELIPTNIPLMLQEMATLGVTMTVVVVCIWAIAVMLTQKKTQHTTKPSEQ